MAGSIEPAAVSAGTTPHAIRIISLTPDPVLSLHLHLTVRYWVSGSV